ncbi:hypothetical protein L484_020858 [Morus notabilis]|uniref:DC1 domain-containing protein n=1 Tax=Morus notabilis TaxID=981085 RepID=W9R2M2_9ROSA|nr:hypothetical protein L484_020858 [Morus notabilis]
MAIPHFIDTEIQHFSHKHPLQYRHISNEIKDTYCFCFAQDCPYYTHENCADLQEQMINHALHPQHHLKLAKRSSLNGDNSRCYYCEKPFEDISMNNISTHATSRSPLPTEETTEVDDGSHDDGVVQYICHQRPMIEQSLWQSSAKCFACQSDWSGPAYSCDFVRIFSANHARIDCQGDYNICFSRATLLCFMSLSLDLVIPVAK